MATLYSGPIYGNALWHPGFILVGITATGHSSNSNIAWDLGPGLTTVTVPVLKSRHSSRGSGQFCQQGSALVKTVGSSETKAADIYNSEACWGSPALLFPMGWNFSEGILPGAMLLWTERWCNAAKHSLCFSVRCPWFLSSLEFLLLHYSPFCWPYPPRNLFRIALLSVHPPSNLGYLVSKGLFIDFAKAVSHACSNEMILNIRSTTTFYLLIFVVFRCL